MATYELFLKYVPVLIVLTPLVGVMNAAIVRLLDRPSVGRTFLPNLCLTASLLLILLIAFDYGPQRSGLFVAESFQFFSKIAMPIAGTDDRTAVQCAFGVDGLSLPLIAMVVLLPLATFLREKSDSCLILSLCLQSSLLAVVTTLDWRIMCGGLLAAALLLRLILARSLAAGILRRTSRWSQRTFFGDVLLAGGMMYLFLLASNSLQIRGENFSTVIFELRDFFVRIEHFQEDDAQRVVEFSLAAAPALGMLLLGVILRLPLWPDPVGQSSSAHSSQRVSSMWIWLYGPVIAVSFATRAFQMAPETAYALLAPVRTLLIVVLLILGLVSCVAPATPPNRSRSLLPLGILFGVGLCTPNPISLAGMYLMLGFLPLLHWGVKTSNAADDLRSVGLPVVPVVLGSLMILVGLFQGSGSGDRGLLELLVTGSGLALFVSSSVRSERPRTSLAIEFPDRPQTRSEFPVWVPGLVELQQSEQTAKPAIRRLLARAVLIVGMLILPQQAWQRIRWDVQKVEFPVVSSEAPLSTNNADSRGVREAAR